MSTEGAVQFSLTDHFGRCVTQASFPGKRSVVFFGFTHCRTVCPRALERLDRALDLLSEDAAAFQPLYITVDPDRDDAPRMRTFLQDRPRILGLTGSAQQLEAARRAFHAFARRKADPDDPEGYAVPHTAFTFVLDDTGQRIAHLDDAVSAEEIADALRGVLPHGVTTMLPLTASATGCCCSVDP